MEAEAPQDDGNMKPGLEVESTHIECPNCGAPDPYICREQGEEINCKTCNAWYLYSEKTFRYVTKLLRTPLPKRLWHCEKCGGNRTATGYRLWTCQGCGDVLDDNKTCQHCGGPGPFDWIRIGDRQNDVIPLCPDIECRRRVRMHYIGSIQPGGR